MTTMSELRRSVVLSGAMAYLALSGCADRISEPAPSRSTESALRADAAALDEASRDHEGSAVTRSTTSVRWSAITRDLIAAKTGAAKPNAVAAFRAFAYLSLAQYRAVAAADRLRRRHLGASRRGAVAAASTVVLGALFPADAAFFESQLRLQESERDTSEKAESAFAAGEAVGRAVGAEIVDLARSDRFDGVWTGTVPIGPGY